MVMINRKFLSVLAVAGFSWAFISVGGCTKISESWTYVAVPDAVVTRPFEPGSQGPLVLEDFDPTVKTVEKPSSTKAIDNLSADQIAKMDRTMADKIKRRNDSVAAIAELKSQRLGSSHPKIMSAQLDLDEASSAVDEYEKTFKTRNRESVSIVGSNLAPAPVKKSVPQTILVASVRREAGTYAASVGRTLIIFIDGKPLPGEYWLTSENSVLINFSSFTAPARTRVGLQGSIRIVKADEKGVVADMAIHDTTEADYEAFNEKPFDPLQWQMPWNIIGRHEFKITTSEDPALKNAQVQWHKAGVEEKN